MNTPPVRRGTGVVATPHGRRVSGVVSQPSLHRGTGRGTLGVRRACSGGGAGAAPVVATGCSGALRNSAAVPRVGLQVTARSRSATPYRGLQVPSGSRPGFVPEAVEDDNFNTYPAMFPDHDEIQEIARLPRNSRSAVC
jgi:hypothetical protein